MSKILVIDNNPEQMRSLRGLIAYRTPHTMVAASSSLAGVRAVVKERPDLIMINVLIYMHHDYSFHRAMQKQPWSASIPIVVHTSAHLEDLTRRQMEVQGVASTLELPASAEELGSQIAGALARRGSGRKPKVRSGGVQAVSWSHLHPAPAKAQEPPAPQPGIRPVNWSVLSESDTPRPRAQRPTPPAKNTESRAPQGSSQPPRPAPPGGSTKSSGFRAQSFERVDPGSARVKGKSEPPAFQEVTYPKVDPQEVKNPADSG